MPRGRSHGRPCGVATVQHDGLGIGRHVVAIVALTALRVVGEAELRWPEASRALGVRIPHAHITPEIAVQRAAKGTGHEHGARTVGRVNALSLVGDIPNSLIPANALPFVAATQLGMEVLAPRLPALALQGILDAVGPERHLPDSTPAQATALLGELLAVLVGVIGLLTQDDAVFHERLVQAAAAARLHAGDRRPHPRLLLRLRWLIAGFGHLLHRGRASSQGQAHRSRRRGSHKRTAVHSRLSLRESVVGHFLSSLQKGGRVSFHRAWYEAERHKPQGQFRFFREDRWPLPQKARPSPA